MAHIIFKLNKLIFFKKTIDKLIYILYILIARKKGGVAHASAMAERMKLCMKKYMAYVDDGRNCFRVAVPAANEKAARKYVEGNGEIIAIKDITNDFPISLDKVAQALKAAQFGQVEIELITRCLFLQSIAD